MSSPCIIKLRSLISLYGKFADGEDKPTLDRSALQTILGEFSVDLSSIADSGFFIRPYAAYKKIERFKSSDGQYCCSCLRDLLFSSEIENIVK